MNRPFLHLLFRPWRWPELRAVWFLLQCTLGSIFRYSHHLLGVVSSSRFACLWTFLAGTNSGFALHKRTEFVGNRKIATVLQIISLNDSMCAICSLDWDGERRTTSGWKYKRPLQWLGVRAVFCSSIKPCILYCITWIAHECCVSFHYGLRNIINSWMD